MTTADARELGISPDHLRVLAHRGRLERIGHGVYRAVVLNHGPLDQLAEAVAVIGKDGVVSGASALDAYGLGDFNPSRIQVTVPVQDRIRRKLPRRLRVRRADIPATDRTMLDGIPIVTVERALDEAIRQGENPDHIRQAIRQARKQDMITTTGARTLQRRLERRTTKPATPVQ